jgi:hypothetical protein
MVRLLRAARLQYVLLVVFVAMITVGLLWGGFGKVLTNGIAICLDCIGLI